MCSIIQGLHWFEAIRVASKRKQLGGELSICQVHWEYPQVPGLLHLRPVPGSLVAGVHRLGPSDFFFRGRLSEGVVLGFTLGLVVLVPFFIGYPLWCRVFSLQEARGKPTVFEGGFWRRARKAAHSCQAGLDLVLHCFWW